MLNDIILFAINGEVSFKPILEKISVDKMGYFISSIRYFVSGIIALPLCFINITNGFQNITIILKFVQDIVVWGSIVSAIAIAAIMANYYLLEK